YKGKFIDPCTKKQHSLTTSQQLSQTDLNKIRQPALSKELNSLSQLSSLSQQSVTTIDSLSDIKRDNNNELLPSLDINNLSFLPKKYQQTSKLAEDIQYSNINKFEDYSVPNIDYENESQLKLRIPSTTEILIKYIHQLLCEFGDENLFKDFPTSMFMLRKHLKISNFITYSVCPKYDKLYTKKEVVDSWDNNRQLS
ncbi:12909_t:CDS:2, partial [Dentiscutata erythropus]